ncbi:MAG: phosphoserine phosphatase [Myxococcales bacterium]|nr:phosphoserine phosphatase [Myxococcales bacterium]
MRVLVDHRSRPKQGERANGDAVFAHETPTLVVVAVIDGLGHGEAAAEASRRAVEALRATPDAPLEVLFASVGRALRGTRGAAMTVVSCQGTTVTAAGVGNVALRVVGPTRLPFTNTPGILGGATRSLRVAQASIEGATRVVLCSDGISSHVGVDVLARGTPHELLDHLFSEHAAHHDDATALVADLVAHDARQ